MSSDTRSYHLCKSGLEDLEKCLLVALAVRTTALSCEPTWDLHSVSHFLDHLSRLLHSQMPRGAPHLLHAQSKGFNSSVCPTHPLASPGIHGHPPCPLCPDRGGVLPRITWQGFSQTPGCLGVPGQVSVLLPHSPPLGPCRLMEDSLQKEAQKRGQLAPKGCPFTGLIPLSALLQPSGA